MRKADAAIVYIRDGTVDRFEKQTGIRVRFVVGHSVDATAEFNIETEQKRHGDILRLNIQVSHDVSCSHRGAEDGYGLGRLSESV